MRNMFSYREGLDPWRAKVSPRAAIDFVWQLKIYSRILKKFFALEIREVEGGKNNTEKWPCLASISIAFKWPSELHADA